METCWTTLSDFCHPGCPLSNVLVQALMDDCSVELDHSCVICKCQEYNRWVLWGAVGGESTHTWGVPMLTAWMCDVSQVGQYKSFIKTSRPQTSGWQARSHWRVSQRPALLWSVWSRRGLHAVLEICWRSEQRWRPPGQRRISDGRVAHSRFSRER